MRRHLITITDKLEFMIISLGGQPDQTAAESMRHLNEYQKKTEVILVNIKSIDALLKERDDIIKVHGYSNKERILKENKYKELKAETEG